MLTLFLITIITLFLTLSAIFMDNNSEFKLILTIFCFAFLIFLFAAYNIEGERSAKSAKCNHTNEYIIQDRNDTTKIGDNTYLIKIVQDTFYHHKINK